MNEWIGDGVNDGSQLLIVGFGEGVSLSIRISFTVIKWYGNNTIDAINPEQKQQTSGTKKNKFLVS